MDLGEGLRFDFQELISVNPTESGENGKQRFWHPEIRVLHVAECQYGCPPGYPEVIMNPPSASRACPLMPSSCTARTQLRGWLVIKKLQAVRGHSESQGEGLPEAADVARDAFAGAAGVWGLETVTMVHDGN